MTLSCLTDGSDAKQAMPISDDACPHGSTWFFVDMRQQLAGPIDTTDLRDLFAAGALTPASHIWAPHLPGWSAASDVFDLGAATTPHQAAAAPPSPIELAQRKELERLRERVAQLELQVAAQATRQHLFRAPRCLPPLSTTGASDS